MNVRYNKTVFEDFWEIVTSLFTSYEDVGWVKSGVISKNPKTEINYTFARYVCWQTCKLTLLEEHSDADHV